MSLLAAGWDVCLVAQEGRTAIPGLRHLTIPMESSRLRRTFLSSWRVLRQALASGAKICHFHDPELVPVGMVLSLLGRKVVYDVHEDVPLQILNKKWLSPWLRRPMAMLTGSAEWLATRLFFAGVVAATPPIAKRFPARTTVTVQNFPEIVASAPAPTAQTLRQRPDRAIYIGSINENRGLREIIRAVHLSNNSATSLILCGQFTDPALEAECRALPAWKRVDFRGWQTSDQVLQALSEAKVGLVTLGPIPNYIESYPIKLFEYMAMGIPVVASDFPLWRSIVEDAGSGLLVDPLNPQEIAEAMDWLMSHPEDAAQMGVNGQRAVADTYNWPGEAAKLLALYDRFTD
ncbi:MAG: glycosyltransferase family 4 protein [Alphaproteobacteria bacterium]|nr:glycosyltransferase family 4 protein [Alphaproteobacteria bacterium]